MPREALLPQLSLLKSDEWPNNLRVFRCSVPQRPYTTRLVKPSSGPDIWPTHEALDPIPTGTAPPYCSASGWGGWGLGRRVIAIPKSAAYWGIYCVSDGGNDSHTEKQSGEQN